MILPDGSEYPVFRPAGANVIEQLRIVDTAVEFEAEALVMECMALIPYLQWLSESKLVRATHAVITNARADHLDVMGPDEEDVAKALAGMVPVKGKLYTAERRQFDILKRVACERKTKIIHLDNDEVAKITPLDLAGFPYLEHPDNLAIALRVCSDLGVEKGIALKGMQNATPDPGAMTTHEIDFFGRRLFFVNGFAANDPESTRQIWDIALERFADVDRKIVIINCRGDRPDRSKQLGEAISNWPEADRYILIGSGTFIFARAATRSGANPMNFVFAEGCRVEEIFESVIAAAGQSTLVMGMANIGGPGLEVVRYFANRRIMRQTR